MLHPTLLDITSNTLPAWPNETVMEPSLGLSPAPCAGLVDTWPHFPWKSIVRHWGICFFSPWTKQVFRRKKFHNRSSLTRDLFSKAISTGYAGLVHIQFNTQSLPHLYLLSCAMIIDGQHHSPEVQQLTDSSEGDAIMFIGPDGLWQQRGLGDWGGMKPKIFWLTLSMPNLRGKDFIVHIILDGRKKNLTAECVLRYADIQGFWRDGSLGKILAIQAWGHGIESQNHGIFLKKKFIMQWHAFAISADIAILRRWGYGITGAHWPIRQWVPGQWKIPFQESKVWW